MLLAGIASAGQTAPNNLRVSLQLIEVAHPVLTEMMADSETRGAVLHDQAMARVKAGEAKLVDSSMVMTRSGERTNLESIQEIMFASESSGFLGGCGLATMSGFPPPRPDKPARHHRFLPPCFETRNTGVTFEVEPTLAENGHLIDLVLTHEVIAPVREVTWLQYGPEWGGTPVRTPIFEVWRSNTMITLMAGQFEFISAITPKPAAPVPAVSRKILVFVRADIVPVPIHPESP